MIAMVVAQNPVALSWSQDVPVVQIGDERRADRAARERLLDEAFGQTRHDKTCERLRAGRLPAARLALVAYAGPRLIGTLRLWDVRANAQPILLLGPLAVAASHRNCGIGARLIVEALARATQCGHRAVVLVGDAAYYGRFGFGAALTQRLDLPGPVERDRFLGLELVAGGLDHAGGVLTAAGRPWSRRALPRLDGERRAA
jgi:predicted N-acetyltransferase YhbS